MIATAHMRNHIKMMGLTALLGLVLLLLPVLSGVAIDGGTAASKRVRRAIPEVEEAELENIVRTEAFVAVLYHDNSKVSAYILRVFYWVNLLYSRFSL